MIFSSLGFLYYFLPLLLILYFVVFRKAGVHLKNGLLLAASIVFYAWGEPRYLFFALAQILLAWIFGLLVERYRGKLRSRMALLASFVVGLGGLLYFKYTDFFLGNFASLAGASVPLLRLALPIGISFYTFQMLSYSIDLYWGKIRVQRNLLSFATYVLLFPQLVAGPIVRYSEVEEQLSVRTTSLSDFSVGTRRFVAGLAKKVMIANVLGELVEVIRTSDEKSILFAWMFLLAYGLHIYFDFSGYSDMAIGLGRMFGFHFPENFNYPFLAQSITEFWRRWHMSLSFWFRDYVYIPLGGNRKFQLRNILIVWFLTGFWHGAAWNFIAWGMYFALLLLIEKYFLKAILEKLPSFARHMYLIFFVLISWALFDSLSMGEAFGWIGRMFGLGATSVADLESLYYLRSFLIPLLIALFGSTDVPKRMLTWLEERKPGLLAFLEPAGLIGLMVISTAFLVDGSFNPFIYFRF